VLNREFIILLVWLAKGRSRVVS